MNFDLFEDGIHPGKKTSTSIHEGTPRGHTKGVWNKDGGGRYPEIKP